MPVPTPLLVIYECGFLTSYLSLVSHLIMHRAFSWALSLYSDVFGLFSFFWFFYTSFEKHELLVNIIKRFHIEVPTWRFRRVENRVFLWLLISFWEAVQGGETTMPSVRMGQPSTYCSERNGIFFSLALRPLALQCWLTPLLHPDGSERLHDPRARDQVFLGPDVGVLVERFDIEPFLDFPAKWANFTGLVLFCIDAKFCK